VIIQSQKIQPAARNVREIQIPTDIDTGARQDPQHGDDRAACQPGSGGAEPGAGGSQRSVARVGAAPAGPGGRTGSWAGIWRSIRTARSGARSARWRTAWRRVANSAWESAWPAAANPPRWKCWLMPGRRMAARCSGPRWPTACMRAISPRLARRVEPGRHRHIREAF
jgi:hypothetical protein